jgi:hypothetical protein
MTSFDDDSFDRLLADSMRQRPRPTSPTALAEMARRRALATVAAPQRSRWGVWVNVAAVAVLTFVCAVAAIQFGGHAGWTFDADVADISAVSASGSTSNEDWMFLCAAAFIGAVLLIGIEYGLSITDGRSLSLDCRRRLPAPQAV